MYSTVSCLNSGFEDNFIDRECLMKAMEQAVNTILNGHTSFCINHISQHVMVFCLGSNVSHLATTRIYPYKCLLVNKMTSLSSMYVF